jgi:hypothetical protein
MQTMIKNHESEHGCHEAPRTGNEDDTQESGEPMVKKPEIAEWLGVTPRTVNTYMRERSIPFYKGPRYVLFKISEVEKALLRKVDPEQDLAAKRRKVRKKDLGDC